MTILLFSGGADSSLIFFNLVGKIDFKCIFLDYGQDSLEEEYNSAFNLCSKFGVELETVQVDIKSKYNEFYIAGRNLFLIGLAATRCSEGDSIYIGVNKSDEESFPDCRVQFITSLKDSLVSGYGIKLETPLLSLSKREILKELAKLNYAEYSYCYIPADGKPCNTCLSCLVHKEAL